MYDPYVYWKIGAYQNVTPDLFAIKVRCKHLKEGLICHEPPGEILSYLDFCQKE